jgi:cell division protein FtsN
MHLVYCPIIDKTSVPGKALSSRHRIWLLALVLFFAAGNLYAQNNSGGEEEIPVILNVQGVGGFEINAVYKNDKVYLPVVEIFNCLRINMNPSGNADSITGFFLFENNRYSVNLPARQISVFGKVYPLSEAQFFGSEADGIVLQAEEYGRIFGLDCNFSFRNLSVELKTTHELPVIKEMRHEQMRKNISQLKGEIPVDTTYQRRYHAFRGGMIDWAIYASQTNKGFRETRAMLGFGAEVLGGETNIFLNYSTTNKFEKRQQQYSWRWANNETRLVRQVTLGKLNTQSVSSIYSPLIGGSITNAPTTYRRSFGSYTMTDVTEPGWTVELYINGVLVDYTTADASGFFKFDIPLVYGASRVLLKFYGPWGEERQREQTINVPYNFLPKGEFQYTATGAMEQDTTHSIFGRADASYGVSRHFTVGGGLEYLSSISNTPYIPFVNTSVQFLKNMLFSGEIAYGVRSKALLSYTLPSSLSIEVEYAKYEREQKAITFNYLEEQKFRLSIPMDLGKVKAYSRFAYIRNKLVETTYSTAEVTLSTFYEGISANFTGNANWLGQYEPYIYGNLGLGFRFFRSLYFRPQMQYDFSNSQVIYTKLELENNFSPRTNLSLVWENNLRSNFNSVELTFRYDFNFAQTSLNARISNQYILSGMSAHGAIALGSGNGKVITDKRSQVGRCGLTVIPFLDINNNDRRDEGEPITSGMSLRMSGGRMLPETRDSIFRIMDLEPFVSYLLEFSDTRFDNIAWQISTRSARIVMDPNQFKLLEVPVKVMGEVSGNVYIRSGSQKKPQGRIIINIFDQNGKRVNRAQSESDGYFSYLGLAPGSYYAEIDSTQLNRIHSVAVPGRIDFEIHPTLEGDVIDNLEFTISKSGSDDQSLIPEPAREQKSKPENAPTQNPVSTVAAASIPVAVSSPKSPAAEPKTVANTAYQIPAGQPIPEASKQNVIPANAAVQPETKKSTAESEKKTTLYFVQTDAFKSRRKAQHNAAKLAEITSKPCSVTEEDGFHKVRMGPYRTPESARNAQRQLAMYGINCFVVMVLR